MSIGKGFTLVEMVVVIAIISICSVGVVTGYTYIAKQEMLQCAYEVQSIIEIMQQKAALKNRTYTLERNEVNGESVLIVSTNTLEESRYTVPKGLMLYIGTEENYFKGGKKICFTKDVSPSESGTLTIWHKRIPYHLPITVRPVTGLVTIYPIENNPGGKSFEEYISNRLYGVW
nr:type II secretion system protein [uncultured Niameybacter sp.]